MSTPYDLVPFPCVALAQTHPERLAAFAHVLGFASPAPPERGRTLELGCADGGNLIPLAASLPEAHFVGVDASARELAVAEERSAELGLKNLTWIQAELGQDDPLEDAGGPFDAVLCHGLFSWVTPEVQAKILGLCRRALAPSGLALINYNTLPGWEARRSLRGLIRPHVAGLSEPGQQIAEARAILQGLSEGLEASPQARLYEHELGELAKASDAYLFHEFIGEVNAPLYVHEFLANARAAGLAYVGEADFQDGRDALFPERVRPGLSKDPEALALHLLREDFRTSRAYRASLLALPEAVEGAAARGLEGLHAACQVGERAEERALASSIPESFPFLTEGERWLTLTDPLVKAAALELDACWPESLPFEGLSERARGRLGSAAQGGDPARLAAGLLELFGAGVLRLSPLGSRAVRSPGDTPRAFAPARADARPRGLVPNLLHQVVALDACDRVLLPALDGARGAADLIAHLVDATLRGELSVSGISDPAQLAQAFAELLPERLAALAARGLLEG